MPSLTPRHMTAPQYDQEETQAYAHCSDPRCAGNKQTLVPAVHRTVSMSYASRGGDTNWTQPENSYDYVHPVNAEDMVCPVCSGGRELTLQERPRYRSSGWDQAFLLREDFSQPQQTNSKADELHALQLADMKRQAAEQQEHHEAQLAAIRAEMASFMEANQKRGPGRPPRATE